MKSWKTTVCGGVVALGTYMTSIQDPSWIADIGKILVGVGTMFLGIVARDNDKSSEQVGTK